MRGRMRWFVYGAASLVAAALSNAGVARAQSAVSPGGTPSTGAVAQPQLRWFKGNTHTHTLNSDGDSSPDDVVHWYREHGYNFLFLTDHNFLTSVEGLNALLGADGKFIVLPGEEVTDSYNSAPIHINALLPQRTVLPQGGATVSEVIQRDVDVIRAAGGAPHLNHPNFGWAVTAADIKRVQRDRLFEIYNGHPLVNNDGGGGLPSLEEMWDDILSSGKLLYGLATDDAHHFKRPWDPTAASPGRGWIMVRAQRLNGPELVAAIERGDFYSSTGVELEDVVTTSTSMTVKIRQAGPSKYRVRFIGAQGRVLSETTDNPAVYQFTGDEPYVRAVVLESNGKRAWVQPYMRGLR